MIKELRLNNWKSFEDATLFIDPLTVLIGSNSSGKSNALDALQFLNRVSQGGTITSVVTGDESRPLLRGGLEWICKKPEKIFTLEVVLGSEDSKKDYRYKLMIQVSGTKAEVYGEELVSITYGTRTAKPKETSVFNARPEESGIKNFSAQFNLSSQEQGLRIFFSSRYTILAVAELLPNKIDFIDGIRHVLSSLNKIFVFDPIPSHMRNYTSLSNTLLSDGSNLAGVLAGLEEDRKIEVEQTISHYMKALPERDIKRIWAEPVGKFGTDAMLYCEEGWNRTSTNVIGARGMSDGTLRYLAIVTALLTREPGSLLVIEEVDNGLHPSRAHILVDMLKTLGKEQKVDVLVTTHNPALLDAFGSSIVPFVSVAHRDAATGFSKLTQLEDIALLPKLMAGGGIGKISTEGWLESALMREERE